MRKNNFFLILLLCIFTVFSGISAHASDTIAQADSVPAPPSIGVTARAAYLMDADTGDLLYALNAEDPMYPASTTKIMTAYLTLKYGDIYDWYTVPDGIYDGLNAYSSTANISAGEELSVYELLQCLMIVSANESANALACYVSGSTDAFVELMNQEAMELGCTNTHFVNANGLHNENHYTTAHDLAIIARAAMQNEVLRYICATPYTTIRATNLKDERTLTTTNYLLPGSDHPEYAYDYATGMKTGYTTPAGYCLVSTAVKDGRTLLCVVLGAEKETEHGSTQIGSFTDSKALLEWGFDNYDAILLYQQFLKDVSESQEEDPSSEPDPEQEESSEPTPVELPEREESIIEAPALTPQPSPELPEIQETPTPESTLAPEPMPEENYIRIALEDIASQLGVSLQIMLLGALTITVLLLLLLVILLAARKHRHKK